MKSNMGNQIIFLLLLLGLCPLAYPSQTDSKSLEQMVADSQVIVQGRVIGAVAMRDAKGRIWTTYTIAVQEQLKGAPGKPAAKQISIRQLGGTVGKVTLRASGVNQFTVGEEAVLFTRDFGGGWQSTFSSPQAALQLRREDKATTGTQHAGAALKSAPTKVNFTGQDEDLESFKAQVRKIINRQLTTDKSKPTTTEKQL